MRFYRDVREVHQEIANLQRDAYLTIGSFDGVHRGHQLLISKVVEASRRCGGISVVITFDPLPREFFGVGGIRLTDSAARAERIKELGVDILVEYKFDIAFSSISCDRFIQDILLGFRPAKMFVGEDFRFGHKGEGNARTLEEAGNRLGYAIETVGFLGVSNERISSTRIRQSILAGEVELAAELIGTSHQLKGTMARGPDDSCLYFKPHPEFLMPLSGNYRVGLIWGGERISAVSTVRGQGRVLELRTDRTPLVDSSRGDAVLLFLSSAVPATG